MELATVVGGVEAIFFNTNYNTQNTQGETFKHTVEKKNVILV